MIFSLTLIPHHDEDRAERELARRRARAALKRRDGLGDPALELAQDLIRTRLGA